MTTYPEFGAGLWHFATYLDRYATDGYGDHRTTLDQIALAGQVKDLTWVDIPYPWTPGVSVQEIKDALTANNLKAVGLTPEIYLRDHALGAFTNPDRAARQRAINIMHEAAEMVRELGARYVKTWPGQDGWDYPFQVDYHQTWKDSVDAMRELATAHPDLEFVIEYKPREPRVHMIWDSAARTLLGIQEMGVPNVGVLMDFGHSLFGGESPSDAAQLLIDHGKLFAMDVNDNFRGWDDDLIAGTVHPVELMEFFYTLRKNNWQGVWQLDQFPFREDSVAAADTAIRFLKHIYRSLDRLDAAALAAAQAKHDAVAAHRLVQEALYPGIGEE